MRYLPFVAALLLSACAGVPAERTVERQVEVTRIVPVEVTRAVEVTRPVEVTREVEITRIALLEVTPVVQVTVLVTAAASAPTDVPLVVEGEPGATTVAVASPAPAEPQPVPTATPAAGASGCYTWNEAPAHVGERACVEGFVTDTYDSGSAFFINFDSSPQSFYAVSFDYKLPELEGTCVRLSGAISEYRGRAQIIIEDPSQQIAAC